MLLDVLFSGVKELKALLNLNGGKTLGKDSFYLPFWQFNWDFVKGQAIGFFGEFLRASQICEEFQWFFLGASSKERKSCKT